SAYNVATMKLVQKQFLNGRREFEILEDAVEVRLKSGFREEKLTVMLAVLNPEPVINERFVEFHSRIRADPLLSLFRDKPDRETFDAFVDELKRRAREEYHLFAGLKGSPRAAESANAGAAKHAYRTPAKPVDSERIDDSILLLQQYLDGDELESLLTALQAIKAEPKAESSMARLVHAFDELGPRQGAVLTYAPYIGVLLSDDPAEY
ncbi:MAG: hypothetical protein PVI79_13030, partial [Gammaproteobacteria bacterium]